jgi:drug/metabolite transporter (DMT)-like permease
LVRKAPWPNAVQWRNALIIGTLMLVLGVGSTAISEQTIPSGMVVAFVAASPVSMAILGRWLLGTRTTRLEALGIALGVLGVLALTQGASFRGSGFGLLMIAIASFAWVLGSLLSQKQFPLAPGAMGFVSEMLIGGLILLALSVWRGEWPGFIAHFPPSPVATAAWLYLVVFGSLIAFNAYMVLLARASAALASSYAFVNPVIGLFLGVSLGGEVVSPFEWAASCVIVMGVVLVLLGRRQPSVAPPLHDKDHHNR